MLNSLVATILRAMAISKEATEEARRMEDGVALFPGMMTKTVWLVVVKKLLRVYSKEHNVHHDSCNYSYHSGRRPRLPLLLVMLDIAILPPTHTSLH